MKLNVKAFAISLGITWGLALFLLTWWVYLFDYSTFDFTFIGELYRGYNISPIGSLIGLIWGFIDGFIGGGVFAWIYNRLL